MKPTIYRGFQIDPVWAYTNGTYDVQYYRISDQEDSGMAARTTLDQVKLAIDERLEERLELYEVQPAEGRRGLRS